ncbi:histidine phosphatase family protein [Ovoidimarina sediminis]|uniref:histidine phosphatase family protein n=1 Tax=Ovoidimarina sediminis TaxID=3079856 RepID=UPI003977D2B7
MKDRTIWWVRHGPTHAKTMVGWSDLPADLSDRDGLARLSDALPVNVPVMSSDLIRTRATAEAVRGARALLPPDPALREMHFGAWELKAHAEIEAEDPERIRAFWETPGEVRPPGGESWNDLGARVSEAVEALLETHGRLIVVAHFGVILSELQRILGWSGDQTFAQRIDPLSLTQIDYAPRPPRGPADQSPSVMAEATKRRFGLSQFRPRLWP